MIRPGNSITNTKFTNLTMLAGQQAPIVLLSVPPRSWDDNHMPLCLAFYTECWWQNPSRHVRVANTYQLGWLPSTESCLFKRRAFTVGKQQAFARRFLKACTTVHRQQSWKVSSELHHLPPSLQAWLDVLNHSKWRISSRSSHDLLPSLLLLRAPLKLTPFGTTW